MDAQQFGKTFLACQTHILKALRRLHIFDEDLLHDTYIALYEHSQHAQIGDFVNTFVTFYRNLHRRRSEREISDTLKISQQAVNKSIRRTIEHLKVVAK